MVAVAAVPGVDAAWAGDFGAFVDRPGACANEGHATWSPPGISKVDRLDRGFQPFGPVILLPNDEGQDAIWYVQWQTGFHVVSPDNTSTHHDGSVKTRFPAWLDDMDGDGAVELVESGLHFGVKLRDTVNGEVSPFWSPPASVTGERDLTHAGPPSDVLPNPGKEVPIGFARGVVVTDASGAVLAELELDPEPSASPMLRREGGQPYLYVFQSNHFAEGVDPDAAVSKWRLDAKEGPLTEFGLDLPYELTHVWTTPVGQAIIVDPIAWTDVDGDGEVEIVFSTSSPPNQVAQPGYGITILETDGQVLGQTLKGSTAAFAVGDVTGNGIDDIVTAAIQTFREWPETPWLEAHTSALVVLSAIDGNLEEELNLTVAGAITGIVLCDLTGDGRDEITVASGHDAMEMDSRTDNGAGGLTSMAGNGTVIWEYRLAQGRPLRVAIHDYDHDGDLDIFTSSSSAMGYRFDPGAPEALSEWVEYQRLKEVGRWFEGFPPPERPQGAPVEEEAAPGAGLLPMLAALGLAVLIRPGSRRPGR